MYILSLHHHSPIIQKFRNQYYFQLRVLYSVSSVIVGKPCFRGKGRTCCEMQCLGSPMTPCPQPHNIRCQFAIKFPINYRLIFYVNLLLLHLLTLHSYIISFYSHFTHFTHFTHFKKIKSQTILYNYLLSSHHTSSHSPLSLHTPLQNYLWLLYFFHLCFQHLLSFHLYHHVFAHCCAH